MAVVRITDAVINDILSKYRSDSTKIRTKLTDSALQAFDNNAFVDDMYRAWQQTKNISHLMGQFPEDWFTHVDKLNISKINGVTFSSIHHGIVFNPVRVMRHFAFPPGSSWDNAQVHNHPSLQKYADMVDGLRNQLTLHQSQEETVLSEVRKLLRNSATLKQAMAVWPQLESMLPSHIAERHTRKVVKAATVTAAQSLKIQGVTIDTDALNTAVVMNRLNSSA